MSMSDINVRSLVRTLYLDQSLSRADMMTLFTVAGSGNVSYGELVDLRTLAACGQWLGMTDAVRVLSSKAVNANLANATYQGTNLGNLYVGSSATQLQKLVNKWFLGLDRPTTTYAYAYAAGNLFVGGAQYTDVYQGAVGDCYLMASLAEAAYVDPSTVVDMFTDNGDGTYCVRYFNNGVADYVTVDRYLPASAGRFAYANYGALLASTANELWVALAEKAYVQMNASGWLRPASMGGGQNSYAAISGGWISDALEQVTGIATTWNYMYSESALVAAVTSGKLVGLGSKVTPGISSVVGSHAYAVVGYNASTGRFTLFNPWGIHYGTLSLTWSQLVAGFTEWDSTV
jgi:hypothetical protein